MQNHGAHANLSLNNSLFTLSKFYCEKKYSIYLAHVYWTQLNCIKYNFYQMKVFNSTHLKESVVQCSNQTDNL